MPVADDVPIFGNFGFSSRKQKHFGTATLLITLNVINLFLVGESLIFFLKTIYNINNDMFLFLSVIVLMCAVFYYLFLHYIYKNRINEAEEKYKIRFPTAPNQ